MFGHALKLYCIFHDQSLELLSFHISLQLPDSSNSLFIDDECARGAWGCWQLPVTDISDLSAMTLVSPAFCVSVLVASRGLT